MVHAQALGEQLVLGLDHVVVVVVWEVRVQAVGGLGRLAVADAVGEHDEIARRVEQAAGREQHLRELRPDEVLALAAGAVQDHHRIDHMAGGVAPRGPEGGVVNPELGQALA